MIARLSVLALGTAGYVPAVLIGYGITLQQWWTEPHLDWDHAAPELRPADSEQVA